MLWHVAYIGSLFESLFSLRQSVNRRVISIQKGIFGTPPLKPFPADDVMMRANIVGKRDVFVFG